MGLYLVAFASGAALMAFELVGSRVLAPAFGSAIHVWGSLISVFLAALAAGYAVGGRLSDRAPSLRALARVLAGASLLVAIVPALAPPVLSAALRLDLGLRLGPLASAAVLFGPAAVLMGMISPFLVRLASRDLGAIGSTAGGLYAASTAGGIAGTLLTAFWLIQALGTSKVVLVAGGSLAATAVGCALRSRAWGAAAAATASVLLGVLLLPIERDDGPTRSPPVVLRGHAPAPHGGGKTRHSVDSRYHHIRVADHGETTRLLHFDDSVQGGVALRDGRPDLAAPPLLSYVRAFDLLPALVPEARRVLFIGLGSGAAPMRLHQLHPGVHIDVVELDPEVVAIARDWFGYDDRAIATFTGDGRAWLARAPDRYDAIVVDAYCASAMPFHLATLEFLEVLELHLTPGGVVAANLVGALEGPRGKLLRAMLRTHAAVFRDRLVIQIGTEASASNLVLFSSHRALAAGPAPLPEGRLRDVAPILLTEAPILTDEFAPIDALLALE